MNVPIILADDLGDGDLGIYGNPDMKPPHIDFFERDGRYFVCYNINKEHILLDDLTSERP